MHTEVVIATYLLYGSKLDGYAAAISKKAAESARLRDSEIYAELLANHDDEIRHCKMQKDAAIALCPDIELSNSIYTNAVGSMALSDDPLWNAVFLNLVEWRAFHQFMVAARRLRSMGFKDVADVFYDISKDELKHVRVGWKNVKSIGGVTPEIIHHATIVIDVLDNADPVISKHIPNALGISTLTNLSKRVEQDMLENLL